MKKFLHQQCLTSLTGAPSPNPHLVLTPSMISTIGASCLQSLTQVPRCTASAVDRRLQVVDCEWYDAIADLMVL